MRIVTLIDDGDLPSATVYVHQDRAIVQNKVFKDREGSCESIFIQRNSCGFVTWSSKVFRNTESEPTGGLTIEYLIPERLSPEGIDDP
jgi:hypothetical protein